MRQAPHCDAKYPEAPCKKHPDAKLVPWDWGGNPLGVTTTPTQNRTLTAIALEAEDGEAYPRFVDEPDLATALSAWGEFEVLSVETLGTVPDMINIALLGKAELEKVRYWKPESIGKILFNHWD